jgi:hypothetical protein
MYERLGFREVCAVNVYEWSPFTPATTERDALSTTRKPGRGWLAAST